MDGCRGVFLKKSQVQTWVQARYKTFCVLFGNNVLKTVLPTAWKTKCLKRSEVKLLTVRMRWHGVFEMCISQIDTIIIQNRLSSNLLGQLDQARKEQSGNILSAIGTGVMP